MKMKQLKIYVLTLMVAVLAASCGTTRTVPVTGRKQNIMVDNSQILTLSYQEYSNYMKTAKKSTDAEKTAMVTRVGQRLASAVETYLKQNGYANEIADYKWEFNLTQDQQANAFCMPGGKIVVYEGIFPYTQTEAGLAIVLGHEIAHAVAMHSAEQYSTQLRQQYGAQILGGVLSAAGAGSATTAIASNVYGLGAKATSLKYSRDNESEADHMGLIFAAMAGYDPNEAVTFWTRMASGNNGNTSTFWSTHPSDQQRIADIRRALPQALRYYKPVPQTIVIKSTENTTQTKSTSKKKSSSTKKKSTRKKK